MGFVIIIIFLHDQIHVGEAQTYPRLHIKAMDIFGVELKDMDGNAQAFDGYWNYVPNQFLVINMTNPLAIGKNKFNSF